MNTRTNHSPSTTCTTWAGDRASASEPAAEPGLESIQRFDRAEEAMLNSAADVARLGGVSHELRSIYLRGLRIAMGMQRDNLVRLLQTAANEQSTDVSTPTTKGHQ